VSRSNKIRLAGAIAILIPVLAGCEAGLNAPTSQFHPAAYGGYTAPSAGTTGITVSNAFVLGPALNQAMPAGSDASVFLSMFTTSAGGDELTKISTASASSVTIDGGTVSLTPNSVARLTGPAPQIVLNDLTTALSAGQTITLDLDFANAGQVQVEVPVEPHAYAYATFAAPAPAAAATQSATDTGAVRHHKHHADSGTDANTAPAAAPTPSPAA